LCHQGGVINGSAFFIAYPRRHNGLKGRDTKKGAVPSERINFPVLFQHGKKYIVHMAHMGAIYAHHASSDLLLDLRAKNPECVRNTHGQGHQLAKQDIC
jgi:hypothetical protein